MIKLGLFLNPHTTRQRILKWMLIISIVLISVTLFLLNLDDIVAYEAACNNPAYVQATITVKHAASLLSSTGGSLDIVLDYNYDGVHYQNIYYQSSKSSNRWADQGSTITVAVNPENPAQPIRNMLNTIFVWPPCVLWTLGLSGLIYTLALACPRFRAWRIRIANKPSFLSRPYGKPQSEVFEPDYLKDIFLIMLPILIITSVILSLIFPHTFSMIK